MGPTIIDPAFLLGPDGPIAKRLSSYEVRPQQITMASAIVQAYKNRSHLIVEAGTGVGKSFAYLTAALQQVIQNHRKVVISTHTISLQEQLVRKDIPFIKDVTGLEFSAILAKGRGNYFCWRRFQQAQRRGLSLFEKPDELNSLTDLYHWALETLDGTLSGLPTQPPMSVWEMVCSDSSTCMGKRCDRYSNCFYQRARRQMFSADIIVTNHALLFTDLAAKLEGGAILPKFELVILDEAHNVESVASKYFGLRLTNAQVSFLLNRIYNPKTEKGVMAPHRDATTTQLVAQAHNACDIFYEKVLEYHREDTQRGGNVESKKNTPSKTVSASP